MEQKRKENKPLPVLQEELDKIVARQSQNFNLTRKKPFLFSLGVLFLGGIITGASRFMNIGLPVASAAPTPKRESEENEPLFSSEISAYPEPTTYATITSTLQLTTTSTLSIPECDQGASVEKCVETVCQEVASTLDSLNKFKIGKIAVTDEDNNKLHEMKVDSMKQKNQALDELHARIFKTNLVKSPEGIKIAQYLQNREAAIALSEVPNCAGASVKVVAILSEQPVIKEHKVSLEAHAAKLKIRTSFTHYWAVAKGENENFICDAWNLDEPYRVPNPVSVFCSEKQVQAGKPYGCANLRDERWIYDKPISLQLNPPDDNEIKKFSPEDQSFYEKEIRRQNEMLDKIRKQKEKPKKSEKKNEKPADLNTKNTKKKPKKKETPSISPRKRLKELM